MAVIGFTSSDASLAASRMLNRHGIVQVIPTATSPKLDDTGPWTFRLCPGDDYQATVLARTAMEDLDAGRCAVLYQNNDYGRELAALFRREYEALGGVIPFSAQLGSGFDDPANLDLYVRQVITGTPDLLLLICQPAQAEVVQRALLRRDSSLPLLGSDSLGTHSALLQKLQVFEGMHILLFYHHDFTFPGNAEFVEAFRSRHRADPGYEAALAYDALMLLHQAVLEGARTRGELRDWLASLTDRPPIPGVAGPISFDRDRRAWRPLHLAVIRNGGVHLVAAGGVTEELEGTR
jgi:branched-chain amino acid transport system substrate-binding protein